MNLNDKILQEENELKSFILLEKIKTVIQDDSLSDFECVERIVCLFEEAEIDAGNRHDFG